MKKIKQTKTSFNPPYQNWIIPLTIALSATLFGGLFFLKIFCPNFFFDSNPKYFNLCAYIQIKFIHSTSQKKVILGYLYWILNSTTTFFNIVFGFAFMKKWLVAISYKPWIKKYMNECSKIINSCNPQTFNDKVAILVTTCNDLTENTILQISKQTHKYVDCWILDDSFRKEELDRVKVFLQKNPQIKYFKRSTQNRLAHPSQMGNIMAWVGAHGNEYDYICEVNTSSLLTETFVENALCYFHSDLLKDRKVGGVTALGWFFYSNTLLSLFNSLSRQFSDSTYPVPRATGGEENTIRGYGSLYSVEALKTINWKLAECSVCDVGRGREMIRNGYSILLNPFDFAGKVGIRDMDGYRKQRIKWNEGNVHMWRHKVDWGPCVAHKSFYMKWCCFFYAWGPIFFIITFIMNICSSTYGVIAKISFPNPTQIFFVGVAWTLIWAPFILIALINSVPISLMIGDALLSLYGPGIYYFRLYDTIFTSLIFKKWSSRNVTKKANNNYSIIKKIKLCWKDALWILTFTSLCLILQFVVHIPTYVIWSNFFITVITPSVTFIFWVFIGEIKIKKGWNVANKEWPDFYKVFKLNYKFVKDHPIWKQQHPNDKK